MLHILYYIIMVILNLIMTKTHMDILQVLLIGLYLNTVTLHSIFLYSKIILNNYYMI